MLDPSPYSDSPSLITTRSSVFGRESHVFEAVSIDHQRSIASRATEKVVSGVADDKTEVVFSREVHTRFDVLLRLG